jgi:hypothetical protein
MSIVSGCLIGALIVGTQTYQIPSAGVRTLGASLGKPRDGFYAITAASNRAQGFAFVRESTQITAPDCGIKPTGKTGGYLRVSILTRGVTDSLPGGLALLSILNPTAGSRAPIC